MGSPCSLYVRVSLPINFWMPEPIFMKLGTWTKLSGVLYKSLPSVRVATYIPPFLLGNGSVETLPR
jgi:hypothetical protein